MTDQNLPATTEKPEKLIEPTTIVKQAVDLMVHHGTHRDEAAKAVGMLPKSLYKALAKPHVKRYFNQQLEVLRTAARARNFHRLEAIREQDSNPMAAVNAIKTLEGLATDQENNRGVGAATLPGLVIVIEQPRQLPPAIDVTPSDEDRH